MDPRRTIGLMGWALAASFCCTAAAQVYDPPWNVRLAGQIGGCCEAVEVVGRYAYVGEGPNLTILDVWNSSSPVPLVHYSFGDFSVHDIQVKDGLAYIAGAALVGNHGLQIVDVTDPSSPRIVSFYPTPVYAQGVYVTDGLAYVACGAHLEAGVRGGFLIIDVSDPTSPTLRGSFLTLPVLALNIYVSDGIAYLARLSALGSTRGCK